MKAKLIFQRILLVLVVVSGLVIIPTPRDTVAAGTWYVSSGGNDANSCNKPVTPCATINGAIGKSTSGDTVLIAAGTYIGTGDQVVLIDRSIFLSGGWNNTFTTQIGASTIDGQNARRGITVNGSIKTDAENLIIREGMSSTQGGGIYNGGNLVLNNSQIINNTVSSGYFPQGGGIFNVGNLNLDNCQINNNTLIGDFNPEGGGIYNSGRLTLNYTKVDANSGGHGIAIYTWYGTVVLNNSELNNNSSGLAAISGSTTVITITNSTVQDNASWGFHLYSGSRLTIDNTTISGNSNTGININGELYLNRTIVSRNTGIGIIGEGTLVLNNSSVSENSSAGDGGGIHLFNSHLTLNNSTIANNKSNGKGGGIFIESWSQIPTTLNLNSSTVANNSATVSGGGIYNSGEEHSVTMQNSIIAGNTSSEIHDFYGNLVSNGYNLIEDSTGANFTLGSGDLTDVDPLLGSLEGDPGYFPLLPGSPAVNAGNPTACTDHQGNPLIEDQRGKPRFSRCDIGAYELQPFEYSNKLSNKLIAHPGEEISYNIILDNPGTLEVGSVQMVDNLPGYLEYIAGSLTASKGQATYQNGQFSWIGTIAAQEQVTVTFKAVVEQLTPLNQPITNTAEIQGGGETFLRWAVVQIEPYYSYCPFISGPCRPLYVDDFSNPASGWPVEDTGKNYYGYLDGEYRIVVRPSHWGALAHSGFQASDYSVSVDLRNPSGTMSSYGIAFGIAADWSSLYTLEIYPDGWYGIYRYDPNDVVTLSEAFSPAILQGSATNHIKIERNATSIKAYANGQLLASLMDGNYLGSRYIGLAVFSYDKTYVDVRFDNFTVYSNVCFGINSALNSVDENNGSPALRSFTTLQRRHLLPK